MPSSSEREDGYQDDTEAESKNLTERKRRL